MLEPLNSVSAGPPTTTRTTTRAAHHPASSTAAHLSTIHFLRLGGAVGVVVGGTSVNVSIVIRQEQYSEQYGEQYGEQQWGCCYSHHHPPRPDPHPNCTGFCSLINMIFKF